MPYSGYSGCPIQDGHFWDCSQMGGKKDPLPKIYQTYPTMMKLDTVVSCLNLLLTSPFFYRKSATFVISRNTDIDCILVYNF